MKVLKGYVQNHNRPKGCITECYIAEESIKFCTKYLSNIDSIEIPSGSNIDQNIRAPISRGHIMKVDSNLWL